MYISPFTISDLAFGSCFYFGAGFHGLHVMTGTALYVLLSYFLVFMQLEAKHVEYPFIKID